jgi:hypothetical protein
VFDQRREQGHLRALRQGQHVFDDLVRAAALYFLAAFGAVLAADARPEHTQIVVQLGNGADGGARVARGALLLDGDGR